MTEFMGSSFVFLNVVICVALTYSSQLELKIEPILILADSFIPDKFINCRTSKVQEKKRRVSETDSLLFLPKAGSVYGLTST